MFERILRFALEQRWLVLLATLAIAALGLFSYQKLPIDAVPDITNVQVQINTEASRLLATGGGTTGDLPIETTMAGLPGLQEVRSLSRYGLSQVTVVLRMAPTSTLPVNWSMNASRRRAASCPLAGAPSMGADQLGLGEIYMWTVETKPGALKPDGQPYTPMDLREIQDWIIKPQLRNVPGDRDQHHRWVRQRIPGRARSGQAGGPWPEPGRSGHSPGAQQRQRGRRLHRAARRAIPDPRARPGYRAWPTLAASSSASARRQRHASATWPRWCWARSCAPARPPKTARRWCWAPCSC